MKSLLAEVKELDRKILNLKWDEEDAESETKQNAELEACSQYEERAFEAIALLENAQADGATAIRSPSAVQTGKLKPPMAPLPSYSGTEKESLDKFFLNFEGVIEKYSYSNYEKFILLINQTSERALTLINSLESNKQSYEEAKALLHLALASPLKQAYDNIQRLLDLTLSYNKDPFEFVSEVRSIREAFKSLKIDVNMVLQYGIWKAMNPTLQNQFILITNNNKPSLQDIEENMFTAIERYQLQQKKFVKSPQSKVKEKSHSMALNVKYSEKRNDKRFNSCPLCSTGTSVAEHPIYRCSKFKTAKEKMDHIRRLNGCEKCGFTNHAKQDCRLTFLKCKHCEGDHFSYLCTKTSAKENFKQKLPKTTKKTSNNTVWSTSTMALSSKEGAALHTFTGKIGGRTIRAMKDTGCETTLILQSVAEEHNLEIVKDNLPLTINGFNSSRNVTTNLVKVPIKMGKTTFTFNALTVPEIAINVNLPKLGVVASKLKAKGYKLADELINKNSKSISNIELILGTDCSHILPVTSLVFGRRNLSSLATTPQGVMLEGRLDRMLENIANLPRYGGPEVTSKGNICKNEASLDTVGDQNTINTITALNSAGEINEHELQKATAEMLERTCSEYLSKDYLRDEATSEQNQKLIDFALQNTSRLDDGRLQMPLLWNSEVQHLLGKNYNLSLKVLKSNLKKLSKNPENLIATDEVFKEQERENIIEKVPDLERFMEENPQCSFLPHMSVFRPHKETTKCRVVYLSNICEKDPTRSLTVSHNQAIHSGPNLNHKLTTSVLLLRFDPHILVFDIRRAFLNIALSEIDQARLLTLWYKNVAKQDFSLVAYKQKTVIFGISCSPCLLMLALYKILILDDEKTNEKLTKLKELVYTLTYMDNGSATFDKEEDLAWAWRELISVFQRYKFELQQFATNSSKLQKQLDVSTGEETPNIVNLLGLHWNRLGDTLAVKPLALDPKAATKRKVLSSLAKNFDPFNYNGPLLNRARIFMHKLQCDKSINWDQQLSHESLREWKNICKQLNNVPEITVNRCVGQRNGRYKLIAFTDASKLLYGTVIYIEDKDTNKISFLLAKNRVLSQQLETKGIPSLEFQAAVLGVETLCETYKDLTQDINCPINIEDVQCYTDSMIVIH